MPDFNSIIRDFSRVANFAGAEQLDTEESEKKRNALISALTLRKRECSFRFKVSFFVLILLVIVLVFLSLSHSSVLVKFKELMSIAGGGSLIGLLTYIFSLRDEVTKISQMQIIANAVDPITLNTMLLTLSAK